MVALLNKHQRQKIKVRNGMQLEMVAGGKGGCGETFLEIPKKAEGCVAAFLTGPGLRAQALSNESNITEAQQ